MPYRIVAVGRRARDPLIEAVDRYLERLNRYQPTELLLVRDADRESEGKALLAKTRADDFVVALDERGETFTTLTLADELRAFGTRPARVVFLIGGADGHARSVRDRADATWSLSPLTLPHRLAWVVLIEQLYRAHTVLRGEKYHRP